MKLLVIILLCSIFLMKDSQTLLNLNVVNIKANKGIIQVLIFKSQDGFPEDIDKAVKSLSIPVKNFSASVVIEDLSPGKYAVSLFHDEDGDGKLKKNSVGLPIERYGFSNNPTLFFGPPSFSKCAFSVGSSPVLIEISLK
jgi:uncharacterized protein (DUF2141 family)